MPRNQANDLATYLAERPAHGAYTCWVCTTLPQETQDEIKAVVNASKRNRRWAAITQWLREQGYAEASAAKLKYHEDRGHFG